MGGVARLVALAAALALCAGAGAQSSPYVEEILPLETKVVHLVNELRARYRGAPQRLAAFDRAQDSWNAYRNGHCGLEAEARGGKSEAEARRAHAACAKRLLESRVKELEGL